ncbi:unnamed protein product, partial [Trichogramma brassicae]
SLSKRIDWEKTEKRDQVLDRLETLLNNESYSTPPPNLLDTFTARQIERLLADHVIRYNGNIAEKVRFIERVAETGYRDQGPEVNDRNGETQLRRTTALHLAATTPPAQLVEEAVVESLFKIYDKFEANYSDEDGYTHFQIACRHGCVDAVTKFLEAGQDPNIVKKKTGDTPLHLALLCRDDKDKIQLVKLLLGNGADPKVANAKRSIPLHSFCKKFYDGDLAKILLDSLSSEKHQLSQLDVRDKLGRTPLHLALRHQYDDTAEVLLRNGADPNLADANGFTPLHIVSTRKLYLHCKNTMERFLRICDQVGKTTLLLVDAKDNEGRTPLHLAMLNCSWAMVETLVRRGADPNSADKHGSTPLHSFSERESDVVFSTNVLTPTSIESGLKKNINALDGSGRAPLHLALSRGRGNLVEWLLRNGADPNLPGWLASTPLHTICSTRNDAAVIIERFFGVADSLNREVEVGARDGWGQTALHCAVLHDNEAAIEFLVRRRGVDANSVNGQGKTPLHLAVAGSHNELLEWLLRNGADPNLGDEEGSTPLHCICLQAGQGGVDSAKEFFKICEEADRLVLVDAKDTKGRTPLQLAVLNLSLDLVEYLLARGADAASFVFPDATLFADRIGSADDRKPELAWRALSIIKRLERQGYWLCQRDATATMKLLDEYQVFVEASTDLRQLCRDDEAFKAKAEKFKFGKKLPTLHELIHLPIERASTRLTSMSDKTWAQKSSKLYERFGEACDSHLCEILLRNFCLGWAMDPFQALIHRPDAPIEVCQMIFEHLANKDLQPRTVLACITSVGHRVDTLRIYNRHIIGYNASTRARSTSRPMQQQQRAVVKRAVVALFGRVHNSHTRGYK